MGRLPGAPRGVWWKLAAVGLAVGLVLALRIARHHYIVSAHIYDAHPPHPLLMEPAGQVVPGARSVGFDAGPGVPISAWYVPAKNGATIVVMHGSNDDRVSMLEDIHLLTEAGFGVLAYDAPGCGLSGGNLMWAGQAEAAAHAAVRWLQTQASPPPARIGALGLSLGGYILAQAAAHDAGIQAAVFEATPPTFAATRLYEHRKWGALSQYPALWGLQRLPELMARPSAEAEIGRIAPRPVLIIGGGQDEAVPPDLARRLYDHARAPKEIWIGPEAEHIGFIKLYPWEYPAHVIGFFTRALLPHGR